MVTHTTRTVGLAGHHQKTNASLALALVKTFLSTPALPQVFENTPFSAEVQAQSSANGQNDTQPTLSGSINTSAPLPPDVVTALENARWPGRCQTVQDRSEDRKDVTWYLDGAHTVESLELCAEWFTAEAFNREK